jgi:hypothetical protein
MKAWWFEPEAGVLGYGDGRVPGVGVTHTVEGKPWRCTYGLHASIRPLDALRYAKSTNIWRVELSGDMDRDDRKIAARERHYLYRMEIGELLHRFSRLCALDVADLWGAEKVVTDYLRTGDPHLRVEADLAALWVEDIATCCGNTVASAATRATLMVTGRCTDYPSLARSVVKYAAAAQERSNTLNGTDRMVAYNHRLVSMLLREKRRLGL